jgi:3-hydroxybutyryl-CoA dehydrogenase
MKESIKLAIVGAGLMGSQIGAEYALGGHSVTYVLRTDRGRPRVENAFEVAVACDLATTDEKADAWGRVGFVGSIAELDAATDLVVESIPEDLELKGRTLGEVASRLPNAILASNTAAIPITQLGEAAGAPERTLGTHYWNPPLLMPPVEIIAGAHTDRGIIERVRSLIAGLGKEAVLVERDVPGFIWNRLQMALLREVLWLVENGVVTPEGVDHIVRSGLARRYRYTGPFDTVALGGVSSWNIEVANVFPVLSNATSAEPLERWLHQTPDELNAVRARRDRGLARELARERRGGQQ